MDDAIVIFEKWMRIYKKIKRPKLKNSINLITY